jgi:PPM family protein phosphatase
LIAVGRTDIGLVRTDNEDAFLLVVGEEANGLPFDLVGFAAIADGMGGHAGGGLASETALEVLRESLHQAANWPSLGSALRHATAVSNDRVHGLAAPGVHNRPGTTLTCLALGKAGFLVLHVGDSRAYIVREGKLSQITEDHTRIAEEVSAGRLSHEEAARSPLRHLLSRSIGNEPSVEPQIVAGDWLEGDLFILCSDGLTEYVSDRELQRFAGDCIDLEVLADELIATAKRRGGADNVTVVLLKCESQPASSALSVLQRELDTGAFETPMKRRGDQ